jgi:hypothetical protein
MLPATPADHPISMFNGVHRYRADICNGSHDLAYYVFAHWPSNAGQRIPAATEVEGGTPPPPPTNLRIMY